MAGDNDHQASTGEAAKRTRKGKTPQRVQIDEEVTDGNETEYFDNEDEGGSESDDDDDRYDYHTLAKILETVPKLTTFDNALVGVLRSTLDTEGEYNVLYLLLDISKNHLTCHQAWKKIEKSLTSEAARTSRWIALLAELNETKMFHADAHKLIKEILAARHTSGGIQDQPYSQPWVNIPKAKRNNKKLDQRAVAAIFIGYSLERKGWLFYSPDYSPNIFWSNSARFMETQCWSDRSEWRPISIRPPPVPTIEEDLNDLGYTEENLFDEREQEPLEEYVAMELTLEEEGLGGPHCDDENPNGIPEERRTTKEREEYALMPPKKRGPWPNWRPARNMCNPETWVKKSYFGLMAAKVKEGKDSLNPTVHEALARKDRRFWEEAMRKELNGLEAMGTWETTDLPWGMNTVDTRWVLKIKTDANLVPTKYKARLVARGFTQREGLDYTEIFAPVAPIQAIRGVLAIAAVRDWEVDSIDVKQAYLNSSLRHDVYLKPPVGTRVPPGKVLKLIKGLYGLKQSVITAYVDDMLIASPCRREVDRTKAEIMDKWGTEDNGPVGEFLGIKITRERRQGRITLDLSAYIKSMSVAGIAGGNKCNPDQAKRYQELVGQLLWVSNTVRPDISFAVGALARYMSEPIDSAWSAAIHLLKYLNQMSDYRLNLGGVHRSHADQPVVMYTDANWASDPTNGRRSTSGAITYVYGCPVSWKSHVQKCVALSAVEAELVAASEAAREALFFSYLLRDLGVFGVTPTLHTDSQGCIQVSKDPAKHWKLKHIDTRYYFVRDHVQDGDISIEFIGMANNVADILTKPLKGLNTTRISRMIGLDMPLRGGVEDALTSPMRDVLNSSSQDQGIGKASGDEEDKQNAKLVGANAAYARGLMPWYAGDMLI
ncbi:uncharacterized protein UHO2_04781 [Ustilago hordei]|uniref:uncharacterized protein n=1 Tax=Ustilago hordei TaxID=120017 RepID=UPI001A635922|nr:uncharacterized protein UHO2_04781 [Ustilago hordei]SYW76540.1 uncharacterized protein UHO2_04781 [Ustilago hordei]